MSPMLQPAPQAAPQARYYASAAASSGGGEGNSGTPEGPILRYNNQQKNALHVLVLVIPIAVVIFAEAVRQRAEIELPIIRLKLQIEAVLPLFLMLLSFMLHRAMRYARIVLFDIAFSPQEMHTVAKISLDDTDAYKINSAQYDAILDPMVTYAVQLWGKSPRNWLASVGWYGFVSVNVLIAVIVYGAIFCILAVTAFYVSQELFQIANRVGLFDLSSYWVLDPLTMMARLILGLSGALLLLAWLNAVPVVLFVLLIAAGGTAAAVFAVAWGTFRLCRTVHAWAFSFTPEEEEVRKSAEQFPLRLALYKATYALSKRLDGVERAFGKGVLDEGKGTADLQSEWDLVRERFGFTYISLSCFELIVIACFAPIRFVKGEGWNLFYELEGIVDGYIGGAAPNPSIQNTAAGSAAHPAGIAELMRTKNSAVTPRANEAERLYNITKRVIAKLKIGDSALSRALDFFLMRDT